MSHSPRAAWLLCGAALLGAPAARAPARGPLEPFELVLQAELVVEGVIADVERDGLRLFPWPARSAVFELELGAVLAGFVPGGDGALRVEQVFERGARRPAPYERGQRAVFFLRRPRDAEGGALTGRPWLVLGAEGEGECPVLGAPRSAARVLFRGAGLPRLQRSSARAFGFHDYGVLRPRAEFCAVVRGLRQCFEWRPGPTADDPFPPETLRRTCSEDELRAFATSSELAAAVVDDLRAGS